MHPYKDIIRKEFAVAQVNFISVSKLVELLTAADHLGQMNVRVLTTNQLALGIDPLHPTSVIDLSKEAVRSLLQHESSKDVDPAPLPLLPPAPIRSHLSKQKFSRTTGSYTIKIKDTQTEHRSLKEVLAAGLMAFEQHKPGTLQQLSMVSPRTKRIVAIDPHHLFPNPDLVEKCSEKLVDNWWFGTNNSAQETKAWLRRGAELSGLNWGTDITTSL